MATPTQVPEWGTETGSSIVASLSISSIAWTSGNTQRRSFSGAPDLSSVVPGHDLATTLATNAENNGTFRISAVDNTAKWVEVYNPNATGASYDEGSGASADILADASRIIEPTEAMKRLGHRSPTRPSDAHENWWKNIVYQWIEFFANGGAVTVRDTVADWLAVDRTGLAASLEFVNGHGAFYYDPTNTLIDDGETVLKPSAGSGRGLILASHPNAIFAYVQSLYGDFNYTVSQVESLNFPSVSAAGTQDLLVTVDGAMIDSEVTITGPASLDAGLIVTGFVSAVNQVTVRVTNITGGAIDPAQSNFRITARMF